MNILLLSLNSFDDINSRGIDSDLMREFIRRGYNVYIAAASERRAGGKTTLTKGENYQILKIRTLNIMRTNPIEKGLGILLIERQFNREIKKHWNDVKFDLILYSTPPITFGKVIKEIKSRNNAPCYLMLKDIFPQNAVDMGMMRKNSFLYRLFRRKEKELYAISDHIGCMSPANCEYVLRHNPETPPEKVELCPNSLTLVTRHPVTEERHNALLDKFNIPEGKRILVYGGNLGVPQGLDFLLKVVEANEKRTDTFIVIVGNGTEYKRLANWFHRHKPVNSTLHPILSKEDYDALVCKGKIGLIFLDPRFTLPNFPSRLLSYLESSMPVLLATDEVTDIGRIAEKENFGLWCKSGDIDAFMANMDKLVKNPELAEEMGCNGRKYMMENYTSDKVADIIEKSVHIKRDS